MGKCNEGIHCISIHSTHFAPGFFTVCMLVNLMFTYVITTGSWCNVIMFYCNSVLMPRYTIYKCNNVPLSSVVGF